MQIKAPRDKVWKFLTDPNEVAKCLPDLQSMNIVDQTKFDCKLKVGIAFIKGTFNFHFEFHELRPMEHATLQGRGQGTGSSIDFRSTIDLRDGPDSTTEVAWQADAKVGGTIAGVGSRLLGSASGKVTNELFECIKKHLEVSGSLQI